MPSNTLRVSAASALPCLMFFIAIVLAPAANAVPSMSRQMNAPCALCHTVYPELTPFGRSFKLSGFALASQEWDEAPLLKRLPVSGLLQVSRTQTRKAAADEMPEEGIRKAEEEEDIFARDRQTIVQAAGFYIGGKIVSNTGALIQYNYDGIERRWGMEMFDLRYGNDAKVAGKDLSWGVSLNNSPTLADIYNSTPMWSFPHTETAAIMPAARTLVDMTLATQVGGVTAYGLWANTVYAEGGFYRSAKSGFFRFMRLGVPVETEISGSAPYWRLAWQKDSGPHFFHIGAYGLVGKVLADPEEPSLGTDRMRDVALDGSYQFIADDHVFSAHATSIREKQDWHASFEQGLSSASSTTLRTSRADVHYWYQRQWGGGLQYFRTSGDENPLRFGSGEPVMGSANGSPNSKGWVAELNWLPIQSVKTAVRYTAYQQFNGARTNYDGFGRNAKDNNSVFLLVWWLI